MTRNLIIALALAALLSACGGEKGSDDARPADTNELSAAARLGEKIFNDKALSASGDQACATCHDSAQRFIDTENKTVPVGGIEGDLPGLRNTPTAMYTQFIPPFHFEADGTPVGGAFLDGRAASLSEQAQKPFTNEFEMANGDVAEVIEHLRSRPYIGEFVALYGATVLDDPEQALQRVGVALAAFENESAQFHPFSSKFDYWVKGDAQLSERERRGLQLFNNPLKGNCAACHPSTRANDLPAMFTDFTYDNLGIPRNTDLAANDDATAPTYVPNNGDDKHRYYDLGLCGPLRDDLAGNTTLCGAFRVPTLRNVAATAPYFHNGRFATLKETLGFYVRRDTDPEQWYPRNDDGSVNKFDDLPEAYKANVNTTEVPYNRAPGDQPALSESEIDDVVAFLCTLTDGFDPARPEAYSLPAQCQ
jgi:cytochrome c peroxidase